MVAEKGDPSVSQDKGKMPEGTSKGKGKTPRVKPPGVSVFSLWRYASRIDVFMVIVACLCSLGAGVLQPVVIIVLGDVLNNFTDSSAFFDMEPKMMAAVLKASGIDMMAQVMPTIMKFIYFGIAILVAAYGAQSLWVFTSERLTRVIRVRYVRAILRQDIGWHDLAEDGSLTTRLALDTQLVQDGVGEKFGIILQSLASFIGGFVVAFVKGWKLALVMFACMPILIMVGISLGIQIKKFTQKTQDVYALAGAVAEQAISGIRTVTSFSLQDRFVARYDNKLKDAEKSDITKGKVYGMGFGFFIFTLYSILGLAFWYASRLVLDGEMLGGNVMVVFFGMLIGAMSLMAIPANLQAITTAQGAAYKVYNVIERVPPIDTANTNGLKPERLEGHIEFREAKFFYPSRPDVTVLHSLSLTIKPGQTVAFVGPSGSGKSTSISLIQRFYDVVGGEVLVDGKNIKDYTLSWLREHIGLVGQEPVLFNMSIKENILMGAYKPVTEEKLIEVCKMANCHNFISMLPNGYDTQVGEHGGMLSGGQKQRIAIARALIKDPQILLLDEATSALDTTSERIVQKALDVASQNRTTITIAHRLSTIRYADLICVMDKGVLVEQGTHDQLIALGGVYKNLVEKQKIALGEEKQVEDAGATETEVFNVPNQEALLAQKAEHVQVSIASADGTISLPDGKEMTRLANIRRKVQIKEEREKQKALPKFSYRRVLGMLKGYHHYLFTGVLGGFMAGAASPIMAFLLSKVVITFLNPSTRTVNAGPMEGANLYAFCFAMLGVGAFIGFTLQVYSFEKTGAVLTRQLRRKTFRSLMHQEIGFYDMPGHSLGALTARLATDAAHVSDMVGKAWGEVAQFIATIITGLTIAFTAAPALAGVIISLAPFSIYASYYQTKGFKGFEDDTKKAYEEASEIAAEAIKEIRTVESLNREEWFVQKYDASLDHPARLGKVKAFRDSFAFALNGSVGQFIFALAFYAGLKFMLEGMFGFSDLFTCMMTIMLTSQALGRSSTFMSNVDKGKMAAVNTFEYLDRQSLIDPDTDGYVPADNEFNPEFSFENIGFTYPARPTQPIFTGEFSVAGKVNQTLAIVGPSGCGKSTTIGMLQRWYDSTAGVVKVGGHDVKTYQLKKGLRKHIALVGQEPVLFDMSIRENIMWGTDRDDVTQDEIENAAKLANIHPFVAGLPDGYNTRVGDKGSQLSGGQKQRIAIARALIRQPKILLLDEATSALDSESEKVVQEAIDKAAEGRTTITIAHRLSTIQNADQIAVVNNGRVVELGRHFDLLALNGVYSELVKQQDLGNN